MMAFELTQNIGFNLLPLIILMDSKLPLQVPTLFQFNVIAY